MKNYIDKKRILLINSAPGIIGGSEAYTITLYNNLIKKGHQTNFLVSKNSCLSKKLLELNIKHYTFNTFEIFKTQFRLFFVKKIIKICRSENIQIIHCNIHREIPYARAAVKKLLKNNLDIKIVLTRHIPQKLKTKYLQDTNGIICVNPQIEKEFQERNKLENLKIKDITFIPPLFDEEKFLNFHANIKNQKKMQNKQEFKKLFFKKNFNINIKDLPVICTIANMPKNIDHKNHPILLKAINKLIYEKNKPVNLVLAGDGPLKNYLQELALNLKIQDYVHFLGFTDKISQILYFSDFKVLPSKQEGLPIVLFEAACLETPVIGATETSLTNVIKHNQTGLLFEQDNIDSLTTQIEKLIDNPDLVTRFGQNAKDFVLQNFSTSINMNKLEIFYNKILSN
ncbi:glycosyltransferase family 4 protein [Candidatus Babeliales bacterium]|nr:glycosyltransferase family 4 protein [Candidatus Babeliales bacterium]MCF7899571.1 glycosyltransferase family 4 protein [Candidatus Babeliales bacterium]